MPTRDAEGRLETHMLGTYARLRWLMAAVAVAFLATLTTYRLTRPEPGFDGGRRDSISAYYHHDNTDWPKRDAAGGGRDWPMRDVFAAALTALGLLLVAYQGYTKRESWALNVAGAAVVVVVFCPMDWPPGGPLSDRARAHYAAAVVFFLGLGYVTLCRSHDTLVRVTTPARRRAYRNAYRVTGGLLLLSPAAAAGFYLADVSWYIYFAEYAGVVAFVSFWVVKSVELYFTGLETPGQVGAYAREAAVLPGVTVAEEVLRPTGGPAPTPPG